MNMDYFYTGIAESSKFILYIFFIIMIFIGILKKFSNDKNWANWIHTVIYLNFIIGGLYGGIRMLTTDPVSDMLIRRMFAWEAWFCFACASFYFLVLYIKQPDILKKE
ncbi:MAG: hypothetical protein HQ509_05450 [Candidatus Marinimicrobia bacterium]|nr:hypothetical protein [Candidatus Neomarinimicrobiota bacterium]